ncbi:putative protein NRT1/ PTR FAMILY 2.2 [Papaver somniferum]|uniref:putative protein NRT1/ PTR FAMILY 2.2 n=1 Tax=Papaver somniferum TaxID=3469 RepID=UPI000E6FC1F4|nr:putative protein NRT1/ PTR FAMILY 2.2 [Papaver somniferum]
MAKVTDGEPGEVILEEEESTPPLIHVGRKRGGWVTFPFVTVAILGLTVGSAGWQANIIVFLITKFNFMSIDAAQVSNIVNGSSNFIPIFAAIMADSSFGNFSVIIVSSIISSMGLILFMLTVTVPSLRPLECALNVTGSSSATCEAASALQLAVLYLSITLDNFGWDWGVGICLVANLVALVVLLVGKRYYRRVELERSPYKSLARVVVATFQKRKVSTSPENRTFYHWSSDAVSVQPSSSLRVIGIGSVRIKMHDCMVRELKEVRFVPSIKKNLISLGTLEVKGYKIVVENGVLKVISGSMVEDRSTSTSEPLQQVEIDATPPIPVKSVYVQNTSEDIGSAREVTTEVPNDSDTVEEEE